MSQIEAKNKKIIVTMLNYNLNTSTINRRLN
jgi:hypothetical protein